MKQLLQQALKSAVLHSILQYGRSSMSRPQSCAHETLKDVLVQTCWQALGRSGWPIDGQS